MEYDFRILSHFATAFFVIFLVIFMATRAFALDVLPGSSHKDVKFAKVRQVWVPGHRAVDGHWVPGHWRVLRPKSLDAIWVPGHYSPENRWIPGHWR